MESLYGSSILGSSRKKRRNNCTLRGKKKIGKTEKTEDMEKFEMSLWFETRMQGP